MEIVEFPGKLCKLISSITSSATQDAIECTGVKTFWLLGSKHMFDRSEGEKQKILHIIFY